MCAGVGLMTQFAQLFLAGVVNTCIYEVIHRCGGFLQVCS